MAPCTFSLSIFIFILYWNNLSSKLNTDNNFRAPENRTRLNLSSNISFHLLHSLRARNDAVLIGINTLIADRPQLNIRDQLSGCEIALARTRPIVVDSNLKFLQTSTSQLRISKPIICCCLDPYHPRFMLAQSKIAEIGGSIISCKPDVNGRWVH